MRQGNQTMFAKKKLNTREWDREIAPGSGTEKSHKKILKKTTPGSETEKPNKPSYCAPISQPAPHHGELSSSCVCHCHCHYHYHKVDRCLAGNSPRTKANNAIPCNTVRFYTIQYDTVQYNTTSCNIMQYNEIPCNTNAILLDTMQYHKIQCNTIRYNSIPCSIIRCHVIMS